MTPNDKNLPKWPLFAWWQNLSKSGKTVETTGIQPEGQSGEPSTTPGPWENVASTLVELLRLSENAAAKILALEKSVGEIPKQGHFELLRGEWESLNKKLSAEKTAIDQLLESHQAMARQLLLATEDQRRTDHRSIQTQWIVLGLVLGMIGLSGYNALLLQGTVNDLRQLRSKADRVQEILEESMKTREERLKSSLRSQEKSGETKSGSGGEMSTSKSVE